MLQEIASSMKGIVKFFDRDPRSGVASVKFSRHSLDRAKFRDKRSSLNVILGGSKNARSPIAPPYDQRSTR